MAKVIMDDKEYDIENMSDGVKAQVAALRYVRNEIVHNKLHAAALETAHSAYMSALKKSLDEEHGEGIVGEVADTLTGEDGNIKLD